MTQTTIEKPTCDSTWICDQMNRGNFDSDLVHVLICMRENGLAKVKESKLEPALTYIRENREMLAEVDESGKSVNEHKFDEGLFKVLVS